MGVKVAQILALSYENIIGSIYNDIPWNSPKDLKYFYLVTKGNPIVMGSKTFKSIGSKPLSKRLNIVVTRSVSEVTQKDTNLYFVPDIASGIKLGKENIDMFRNEALDKNKAVYVIGGAAIYNATKDECDYVLLNRIEFEPIGDYNNYKTLDISYLREYKETLLTKLIDKNDPLKELFIYKRNKHSCHFSLNKILEAASERCVMS